MTVCMSSLAIRRRPVHRNAHLFGCSLRREITGVLHQGLSSASGKGVPLVLVESSSFSTQRWQLLHNGSLQGGCTFGTLGTSLLPIHAAYLIGQRRAVAGTWQLFFTIDSYLPASTLG